MSEQSIFAGIEVSKERLDLALRPSGTVRTLACGPWPGLAAWYLSCIPWDLRQWAWSSPGGLELPLAGSLAAASLPAASLPVAVVNPRQARDFAKDAGRLPRPMCRTPKA